MSNRPSHQTVVIEFGAAEVDAVILCIRTLVGAAETSIEVLRSGEGAGFDYTESDLELEELKETLIAGDVSSILVVPVEQRDFHAMLFCPKFDGDKISLWTGVVELTTGYETDLIHRAKRTPGLEFVSISLEDDLDLPDSDRITEKNFPWDDWRLVEAVVANGEPLFHKEVRRGPAARKVTAR